jgi:hypothetical protein
VCTQCERRTRPEAPPLCPKCWELRAKSVHETAVTESKRLQIGGLVVGALSFFHPLIMVASLVVNIRELVRGTGGTRRWMNVVGVSLTGLAMLVWLVGILVLVAKA